MKPSSRSGFQITAESRPVILRTVLKAAGKYWRIFLASNDGVENINKLANGREGKPVLEFLNNLWRLGTE
jgi:hypothetical protein